MRKNSKIISFISLFIFFVVIFTFFNMDTKTKIILSVGISALFLIMPFVLAKINKIHAQYYLKKIREDAIKGFRISPEEAAKLFYLDDKTCIRINPDQLEKCNLSRTSKEILLSTFESP